MIRAGEVAGEKVPRSGIGLAIGEAASGWGDDAAGGEVATLQFVVGGIVAFGLAHGNAIGGSFGEAKAETITLDALVGRTVFAGGGVLHAVNEAARRITGNDKGIDGLVELPVGCVGADAVFRFAVSGIALASDDKGNPGEGEKISLVSGIDEDVGAHGSAVFKMEFGQPGSVFAHSACFAEAVTAQHGDVGLPDPFVEDRFRHMRFEAPESGFFFPLAEHRFKGLESTVAGVDPAVKFEGESAHGGTVLKLAMVVDVSPAETFDAHASEMLSGLDENDFFSETGRLHGRDDSGAGASVDAEIGFDGCSGG